MKLIFWSSTSIVSLFLLWSSYSYIFSKATIDGVRELGFPDTFRIQLAILKSIAVIIILLPNLPIALRISAYTGVALFLLTAIVAHIAHKDPIVITIINIIIGITLAISYVYCMKLKY